MDFSYHPWTFRTVGGILLISIVWLRVRTKLFKTYCNSRYGCELWSLDNACINEFDVAWRKAVRRVLKIPADTHSYLLPLLMDMLPFTDDIHKRSASFITACLKSDSTLVRSIAEFVIVGRCRKAGWNCFSMATAVRSSVKLVMASVLRRTSPTYVASSRGSLDAVTGVGSVYSVY